MRRRGRSARRDRCFFLCRRTEEKGQHHRGCDCCNARNQEQSLKIHDAISGERLLNESWPDLVCSQRPKSENHQVEQALGARARILGKELVNENVNCREEKRVTNSME